MSPDVTSPSLMTATVAASQPLPRSSDLMGALAAVEARFPVLEWRVGETPIWPLVRVRWMFAEWSRLYAEPGSNAVGSSAMTRVKNLLLGPLASWWAQHADRVPVSAVPPGRSTGHDIVLLSDGVSFGKLGGRWFERFCDPLIAVARSRGLSCTLWTPGHHHRQPRATASRFIQPAIDRANIRGALASRLKADGVHLPGLDEVRAFLAASGFESASLHSQRVASDGFRVRALADAIGTMLRKARPRLAFVVGYYGVEGMAFVLACRDSGIPVVDLQHGVQGAMHPAYAAWPRPTSGQHPLLPNYFWVWSQWECEVIERWSRHTGHHAVVGGNPWSDIWLEGSSWPGVDDACKRAAALKRRTDDRPVVLVTLQFGLSASEQLAPLRQLLAFATGRLTFWVRLHPVMLERREEVREALRSGPSTADAFVLDEASDLPLHALLQQASVHLTHSSTAVIEAANLGVHSVVTSSYGEELFGPLYAAGWVVTETGAVDALTNTLVRVSVPRAATRAPAASVARALDALLASGTASHSRPGVHT